MHQRQNRTCRKRNIAEPEPDIKQHTDCSNHYGNHRILFHLLADCTGDTVRRDLFLINAKGINQSLIQLFSLVHAQSPGLNDYLIGSGYLLCLSSRFPCYLLHNRHYLRRNPVK